MSKSKKPRRKYSPAKTINRALDHIARNCYLFRWASKGTGGEWAYSSGGRHAEDQVVASLEHAMARHTRWIVMVHATFLDGDDYYERGHMWITDPMQLAHNADQVHTDITAAVADRRSAGNPAHYYDTVIVMRPLSDRALALADDDSWLKYQADFRADSVMREAMIERLSTLNIPAEANAA